MGKHTYAMRRAMNQMDGSVQEAEEKIRLFARAIEQMLGAESPDKKTVIGLLGLIEYHAFDAMNTVNSLAEDFDATYREEEMPWPEVEPPGGLRRQSRGRAPEVSHG